MTKYIGRGQAMPRVNRNVDSSGRMKYHPTKTKTVYRDMRKNVIIKDENMDRHIKYLEGKQRDLRGLKIKIVELEKKIDKERAEKRALKRKLAKKNKKRGSQVMVKATMPLRFNDDVYIRLYQV